MSGLCAALEECQSEALLFVPCDAPLFTLEAGQYLCSLLTEEYDGVVAVSSEGGEHPLCAVYRKSAAAAFRSTLESGENRVYKAFSRLNLRFARLEDAGIGDEVLMNVNSPEDYEELKRLRAK